MKTLSEFQEYYRQNLVHKLQNLDNQRKESIKKIMRSTLLHLVVAVLVVFLGFFINKSIYGVYLDEQEANVPLIITLIAFVVVIVLLFSSNSKIKSKFVLDFKNTIISDIVKFIHNDLEYLPQDYLPREDFIKSKIFHQTPDKYFGDDYVRGKIEKTELAFSEVHAKYKTTSTDENGSKERWENIFDGLMFKADFHKNFNGEYFILPDIAEKYLGKLGNFFQKMKFNRGKLIKLEDIEFEKQFAVYGSDEIEARYILSANMMRRILDFKIRTGKNILISFVDSCVFVAIPYNHNLFEPNFYKTIISEKMVLEYFTDLELAISIVEELNLNVRIWTKQ